MIRSLWTHDRFHAFLTFCLPWLVLLSIAIALVFGKDTLDLRVHIVDTVS